MKYIIVEIQTLSDNNVAHLTFQMDSESTAEQKYHTCLAAAAVSGLPCHAVTMLDAEGRMIKREMYKTNSED